MRGLKGALLLCLLLGGCQKPTRQGLDTLAARVPEDCVLFLAYDNRNQGSPKTPRYLPELISELPSPLTKPFKSVKDYDQWAAAAACAAAYSNGQSLDWVVLIPVTQPAKAQTSVQQAYGGTKESDGLMHSPAGAEWTIVGDWLVVGDSPAKLRQVLQILNGRGPRSLDHNPRYSQARARIKSNQGTLAYLDGLSCWKIAVPALPLQTDRKTLSGLNVIQTLIAHRDQQGVLSGHLSLDTSSQEPLARALLLPAQRQLRSAAVLPLGQSFSMACNDEYARAVAAAVAELFPESRAMAGGLRNAHQVTWGMDTADYAKTFSGEWAFSTDYFRQILQHLDSELPDPTVVLLTGVSDATASRPILEKHLQHNALNGGDKKIDLSPGNLAEIEGLALSLLPGPQNMLVLLHGPEAQKQLRFWLHSSHKLEDWPLFQRSQRRDGSNWGGFLVFDTHAFARAAANRLRQEFPKEKREDTEAMGSLVDIQLCLYFVVEKDGVRLGGELHGAP